MRNIRPNRVLAAGLLAALAVLGLAGTAYAQEGRYNAYIEEGRTVDSTLFSSGRDIVMAGEVEGDMFCAGQNVNVSGRVRGDVICAAQNIRITGTVEGDVRIAAQTTSVSGEITGSLSSASQSVQLEKAARIGRDASLAATDATVSGSVGRDLWAGTNTLTVNGPVGRDVKAHTDRLTLGSSADIEGAVRYASGQELQRDRSAQVAGSIDRTDLPREKPQAEGVNWAARLLTTLALLASAMLLAAVMPGVFHRATGRALDNLGKTLAIGIVTCLVAPLLIIILMLTVVGIPAALLLLLVWLTVLMLSGPFAAYLAGRLILKQSTNALLIMLAGAALLLVLYQIPFVQFVVWVAVLWFGVGTIIYSLWQLRRKPQYDMAPSGESADGAVKPAAPAANTEVKQTKDAPRSTRK